MSFSLLHRGSNQSDELEFVQTLLSLHVQGNYLVVVFDLDDCLVVLVQCLEVALKSSFLGCHYE